MSRYLGIDYGDKRIGVAFSDAEGHFAFPKETVLNDKNTIENIKKIIQENNIIAVILGLPQNFSGEDTEQTKKVRAFADELKKELAVDVVFENEILTSRQIEKTGASTKSMIDASSAALILQGYLNRKRKS